jgi:hypothetical protein
MLSTPDFRAVGRVLRQLPEEYEARIHTRFRTNGGSTTRWQRRDWGAMADAITRLEDWLELERPRFDRTPLCDLRRRLEDADDALDRRRPSLSSANPEPRARGHRVNVSELPL